MADSKQAYACPEKILGKMVFWYPGGNIAEEPWVTLVSKVNMASLRLHVISAASPTFKVVDGVRHHLDAMNSQERQEFGCWEFPQERIDRLEAHRVKQRKAAEEADKAAELAAKRELAGAR